MAWDQTDKNIDITTTWQMIDKVNQDRYIFLDIPDEQKASSCLHFEKIAPHHLNRVLVYTY